MSASPRTSHPLMELDKNVVRAQVLVSPGAECRDLSARSPRWDRASTAADDVIRMHDNAAFAFSSNPRDMASSPNSSSPQLLGALPWNGTPSGLLPAAAALVANLERGRRSPPPAPTPPVAGHESCDAWVASAGLASAPSPVHREVQQLWERAADASRMQKLMENVKAAELANAERTQRDMHARMAEMLRHVATLEADNARLRSDLDALRQDAPGAARAPDDRDRDADLAAMRAEIARAAALVEALGGAGVLGTGDALGGDLGAEVDAADAQIAAAQRRLSWAEREAVGDRDEEVARLHAEVARLRASAEASEVQLRAALAEALAELEDRAAGEERWVGESEALRGQVEALHGRMVEAGAVRALLEERSRELEDARSRLEEAGEARAALEARVRELESRGAVESSAGLGNGGRDGPLGGWQGGQESSGGLGGTSGGSGASLERVCTAGTGEGVAVEAELERQLAAAEALTRALEEENAGLREAIATMRARAEEAEEMGAGLAARVAESEAACVSKQDEVEQLRSRVQEMEQHLVEAIEIAEMRIDGQCRAAGAPDSGSPTPSDSDSVQERLFGLRSRARSRERGEGSDCAGEGGAGTAGPSKEEAERAQAALESLVASLREQVGHLQGQLAAAEAQSAHSVAAVESQLQTATEELRAAREAEQRAAERAMHLEAETETLRALSLAPTAHPLPASPSVPRPPVPTRHASCQAAASTCATETQADPPCDPTPGSDNEDDTPWRRAFWPRRWAPGDVEELLRKAKALNMNLSPYFDRLTWVTGSNLHSQPEEQLA